ncbi:MAG: HAD family phosphatase [Eubacterium sp.]|nr:HAD family phosphatase [Eubacterium sp.]
MNNTQRKILFSDLDGTLLTDQKEIEKGTREAVEELLAQGHVFALCTGRPLASARKVAKQFGLEKKGCFVIAYNGGVLYDPGQDQIVYYASIPLPLVHRMFAEAELAGLYVQTYDRADHVLTNQQTEELDAYLAHTKLQQRTGKEVLADLADPPAKMIVISHDSHEKLCAFQEKNAAWAGQAMNSFFSCEQYLEYCPAGSSKATGVQRLCAYLGIPVSNSVAAGDERNDLAMLQAAGIAAVPAKAHPAVRAAADYLCRNDHNTGAVGEIIRKFILADQE